MKEPIIRTHNREIDELFERYRRAPGSHVFAPLADAYRKLGLVEEALDLCARGLSANPRYASGYVVQGKCEYDAGHPERAEASFTKVLEIDAQNLVALRYLGIIRASCGDPEGARTHFEHILTLDPSDKEIRQRLDAVLETLHVSTDTLVDEIEQVLQPDAEKPVPTEPQHAAPPLYERVRIAGAAEDKEQEEQKEEIRRDQPIVRPEIDTDSTRASSASDEDEVIELPDVPEELVGTPIVLSDDAETSECIATVTLADIFANQGYTAKALKIYQDVLRRQPNNEEVRRKITALRTDDAAESKSEPIESAGVPAPAYPEAPPVTSPAPPVAQPSAVAAPSAPTGAAIDEGRSYEQFKRWLRSVSD